MTAPLLDRLAQAIHPELCPDCAMGCDCDGEPSDLDRALAYAHLAALIRAALIEAEKAEAWDDGYDAGDRTARAVNPEWPDAPVNPYRQEDK